MPHINPRNILGPWSAAWALFDALTGAPIIIGGANLSGVLGSLTVLFTLIRSMESLGILALIGADGTNDDDDDVFGVVVLVLVFVSVGLDFLEMAPEEWDEIFFDIFEDFEEFEDFSELDDFEDELDILDILDMVENFIFFWIRMDVLIVFLICPEKMRKKLEKISIL